MVFVRLSMALAQGDKLLLLNLYGALQSRDISTMLGYDALRDANLRADRHLDYGLVLAFMSRLRKAGIEHFGLIAEEPPSAQPQPK